MTSLRETRMMSLPRPRMEMHDYGKAATVLSIFKSKARRTLDVRVTTRTVS
jgi:hypothetical protein